MITLIHDYTSPASAVAVLRCHRLLADGLKVNFEGIDRNGVEVALPATLDVLDELERSRDAAAELGLELRKPGLLPPTVRTHAVGDLAQRQELGVAWREAAYRAFWEDGIDISLESELLGLAERVGLDVDEVDRHLADPASVRAVRMRAGYQRGRGVGGVPVVDADGTLVPATIGEDDLRYLAGL